MERTDGTARPRPWWADPRLRDPWVGPVRWYPHRLLDETVVTFLLDAPVEIARRHAELWRADGDDACDDGSLEFAEEQYVRAYAAAAMHEELGWERATIAMELGTLRGRQGRHAEALELYEVARRGYEDHGSDEDRCRLDLNLAPTLAELAGVDAALAVLDHATALADAGGHELLGAHLRYTRGNLAMTSGAYEGALGCFEQARARYEALGEVGEVADCDSVLGVLLCEMQPPAAAEAERLQRRALAVYEEHGTLIDRLVCRTHLGHTLLHAGRLDAAAAELRQVVAEARARGLGDVLDDALTMLAEVDPDEAAVVRAELRRGR